VGTDQPTYTCTPANNDEITCTVTSDLACPLGNPATSAPYVVSTGLTPVVTYAVCHDLVTTTNGKPIKLKGGLPLGGIYEGPGVVQVANTFIFNPDPLAPGPDHALAGPNQITYTYTTAGLCAATGLPVTIMNLSPVPLDCTLPGATLTDVRDNQVYPVVQIGTQCWFASNLNYGDFKNSSLPQTDNCMVEKYCPSDNAASCGANATLYKTGGLYQWDELLVHTPSSGAQGLCPPGWHLPTDAEWLQLFNVYALQSEAGRSLKDAGTGGFHALMGGVLYQNQTWSFNPPGFAATIFWTSDAVGNTQASSHGMNSQVPSISDYVSGRNNGFSVRCLRDN
jgi:uncharacterized protein (TIGR02145 family)